MENIKDALTLADTFLEDLETTATKKLIALMFGTDGRTQIKFDHGKIIDYPADIYYTGEHNDLNVEVALVGASKNDVHVEIVEGDTLIITYTKPTNVPSEAADRWYAQRIIKRSNFKLAVRLLSRYDVNNITVKLENGLLHVFAPVAENMKARPISIT